MEDKAGFTRDYKILEKTEWFLSSVPHINNVYKVLRAIVNNANYGPSVFNEDYKQKLIVRRGQMVTSLPSLSAKTGLTEKQVRGAISKLVELQDIVTKSYNKFRVITLCRYEDIVSGNISEKDIYLYNEKIKNSYVVMKNITPGQAEIKKSDLEPGQAPSPTVSMDTEKKLEKGQAPKILPGQAPKPLIPTDIEDFSILRAASYIEPNSKKEYDSDRSLLTESMINKNSNNTSQSQNFVEKTENPLFSQNFVGMPTPEQLKALQDFAKKKHEEFLKLPDYPYGKEKRTGMPESYRLKQTGKDPLDEYRAKIITGDPLAEYRSKVNGEILRESYRKPFVRPQAEPKPYPTDTHFDQVMEDNEITGDIEKDDEILILGSKKSFYRDFDKRMKIFKRMIDGESPLEIVK